MLIAEIFETWYRQQLNETVFDVLNDIPPEAPSYQQMDVLQALVMFVNANNQRPGIMQLTSFYLHDNVALFAELKRLADNHPREFGAAREYIYRHGIVASKQLVQQFFTAKQNNVDMVIPPARPAGPRMPQRPVGGDRGRMQVAGRRR